MIQALLMITVLSTFSFNAQAQNPNQQPRAQMPAQNQPVQGQQPAQARPAAQPALNIQSAVTPMGSDSPIDSILSEEMIKSLRDPFQMPMILLTKKDKPKTDLETFQIKDFKLNGVITGPKKTKAMVTAPNGKTYFISVGDHIGIRDGHVSAIQSDAIKVVEYDVDDKGRRTPEVFEVRINGEVESLSKKEE
jgi:hypothetical protein